MLKDKTLTYISLFSSAGVGCYGFKEEGYKCIATNEYIERRLNVQRFNNKCQYESGYINDDITTDVAKEKIYREIDLWKRNGNDRVDVLIATPPCQGMSVANHKKAQDEIKRNSLVVESIQLIKNILPRFFILENVAAFMKTGCTTKSGEIKAIGDVIDEELSDNYIITSRILNFKNYGSYSSRTRTLVIGVCKELSEFIAPVELYPTYREEKILKDVIGNMPHLEWGEICSEDFYHAFRTYPEHMREWISDIGEGESAFDNSDERKRPHKVVDGKMIPNTNKNGDKYTRQVWAKVGPCVHTRNDQLASQNTVHPTEDRVFSIRELMKMMSIPDSFKWTDKDIEELNRLTDERKARVLKKEEIKIRQSIGEAVPTAIFRQIAKNICEFMKFEHLGNVSISRLIQENALDNPIKLISFIKENSDKYGYATLSRIAELANTQRENNAAYYTNKYIVNKIFSELPNIDKNEINILEPSVGVGNFIPFLIRKYESIETVNIDVVDIDEDNIEILKLLVDTLVIPDNIHINYYCQDALLKVYDKKYDVVVGNPPFSKLKAVEAKKYIEKNINKDTTNTFEFFLEKAVEISDYVAMIVPKAMLNTPEFQTTRDWLSNMRVDCIMDFGENGFKGVLVETICVFISTKEKPSFTKVISLAKKSVLNQKQSYITDKAYPYWVVYRNEFFDSVSERMEFDRFTVFRDRQITNSNTHNNRGTKDIRVIKSRNISDDGKRIIDIPGYDSFMDSDTAEQLGAYKFINNKDVYLTPNMTYKPRVIRNIGNVLVNGSVAVLIPKESFELTDKQMEYFSTDEYRDFYQIARNYQTRSLNVDATSVFFYGVLKENA